MRLLQEALAEHFESEAPPPRGTWREALGARHLARGTWRETHEVIFADAALSQIGTVGGTAQTQVLPIESATALPDHRVTLQLDPVGGAHATAEELQYQLPGELEFGHSTPIVGNEVTVGPFTPGITINFRTHISNSNPGFVTSDVVSAVA